ncbi:MAG TPA: pitrilysin family protein [Caulobacteraceae bacterium]
MRRFTGMVAAMALMAPAMAHAQAARGPLDPAPVAELLRGVDVPYETFTLDNGLTVLVHEDRKAPVVAVAAWYNIGSKDEPQGRTGFAHLFEHIMLFNGTEHIPNLIVPLRDMGATDWNGTTWFDRTNYFETVPTPALERALYIESERMGYILAALSQERLDAQRGIVQNEKRQGDNQPYGLTFYAMLEALFPEGHPYRHSTIGSMADLDAASLEDVRQWFRDNYGPNNAVLVLSGDIDAVAARPLVERYFGQIARGPRNDPAEADVPTLPAPVSAVMHDRVSNTRLYRVWAVPGLTHADQTELDIAAQVLGGLASSRLDTALVRGDQTAVSVSASLLPFQRVSLMTVSVDVKAGADADAVSARLDQLISEFAATGPTADEVQRVATGQVSQSLFAMEQVGGFSGKTVILAEGAVLAGDPRFFRRSLMEYAEASPPAVTEAMQRWLTRPAYSLRVDPGAREAYVEAAAERPAAAPAEPIPSTPREPMPAMGDIPNLDFPAVERARLSNGVEVVYAHRGAVPVTLASVEFDAGVAADAPDALGVQSLMAGLLDEGAAGMTALQLAEARERLGANITIGSSLDRTTATMSGPSANVAPALSLMADIVQRPTFAPEDVERVRGQQLAAIARERTTPIGLAQRALRPALYGPSHPYGRAVSGLGEAGPVQAATREDLLAFHQRWIRPDNARIFIVSDRPLAELTPMLEERFGTWAAPASPRGTKAFDSPIPDQQPRIILVDRPQSPQSQIYAGRVLPFTGQDDLVALNAANSVVGNDFLSRINTDIRETKGWSYGVSAPIALAERQVPYLINAPVQANRTGESITALLENYRAFRGDRGVTEAERERTINGNIRQLAGSFETSAAILGALRSNALYGRPDNYWETIADRYRTLGAADLDTAARAVLDADQFVWVVVGDAATVRPQLEGLGLLIEVVPAAQ